jgi:hypothetical protein
VDLREREDVGRSILRSGRIGKNALRKARVLPRHPNRFQVKGIILIGPAETTDLNWTLKQSKLKLTETLTGQGEARAKCEIERSQSRS